MGLDMHLSARGYWSQYSPGGGADAVEKLQRAAKRAFGYLPPRHESTMNSIEIEVPLMYWRKFNALHGWFVNNVQDGKDECQSSYVDFDKLRELDKLVCELFMAHSPALVLARMPPTKGFFFGSTEINDWFWEDLRVTMEGLHKIVADIDAGKMNAWSIYYHASW